MKKGQTLTEYAIIILVIAIAVSIVVGIFQKSLNSYFRKVAQARTGTLGLGP